MDLIHARSERAARLATAQLEDTLGQRIRDIYSSLLAEAADIEAMLDFPDDELPQSVPQDAAGRLSAISTKIQALLDTWQEGHVLREGSKVVIAGAPNVGKSTLLNLLAGRDRAIVSPHPGTTRDTIEEDVILHGYPIQLVDTAGLRDAPCEIEQEGIRRTKHAISQADLCICLVDASQNLSETEKNFIGSHNPEKIIVLLNKTDLGQIVGPENLAGIDAFSVSLKKSPSLDEISKKIIQKTVGTPSGNDHGAWAISERHNKSLLIAKKCVINALKCLNSGSEADYLPAATHVRDALEQIGYILGKNCTEEMLSEIFSRFCVGK